MNNETQSLQILRKLTVGFNPFNKKYSEIIDEIWSNYQDQFDSNNSLNGVVFEELLGYVLTLAGCMPFYMQAKVAYVPNVNYDFICYDTEHGPVSLSAKTSLRERWKQADLEAVALKYVHRNASSYLVTLDEAVIKTRLEKINDCMGLNDFVLATSHRFDVLIEELKERTFSKAGVIDTVTSNIIIDSNNHKERYGN